jgi:O-antigen ligase
MNPGTAPHPPPGVEPFSPPRLAVIAVPLLLAVGFGWLVAVAEVNALIVFVSLLISVFILIDFRIGVVCLILLMPISASTLTPHSIGGITGLSPVNILLIGTLAGCLVRGLPAGGLARFVPAPLIWLYLLPFVAASFVGANHVGEIPSSFFADNLLPYSNENGYLRDVLVKPLFLVLFALLVGAAAARSERPEKLIYALLASIWAMGLMSIVYFLISGISLGELAGSQSRDFFRPLGLHANALGRLYAVAYALMLFSCGASRDPRLRTALIATMGMVVVALLLTFSRSAFAGFVVVNALFLLSRRKFSILIIGAVCIALVALILPNAVYDRVGTGWNAGLNVVSAGRTHDIWLPLLPDVWNHLVIGNGTGAFLWSDAMRAGSVLRVDHPHNAYLQSLLNMGLIGTVLVAAYYVHVWRGFRQLAADPELTPVLRGFYAGAIAGLFSFLLAGISGSSLTPCIEQIFLWLAIGMMYGQRHLSPRKAPC